MVSHGVAATGKRLLEGIKVVELATVVAAPACCAILADLGADVLKIENPDIPDTTRGWIKMDDPAKTPDPVRMTGSHFSQLNRGKSSITLNYQEPEGLQILKRLMAGADIFVTNVRNKSLKKLGLDYESVSKDMPQLIYGHLSAWGQEGPKKDDPGYDFGAFWAYSGIMDLARYDDDAGMPRFVASIGDNTTAMQLVAGLALALLHRQITGEGQFVDAALLRSGIWSLSHPISCRFGGSSWASGKKNEGVRGPWETGPPITMGVFRCKDDRWIQLLGMEAGKHWNKTLAALGIPGKIKLNSKTNFAVAREEATAIIRQKTYAEWHDIFDAADVWHSPVNRFEDIPDDPQANAVGAFREVPGLRHKLIGIPVQLSSQAGKDGPRGPAPAFGEHTAAVLADLGYSLQDVEQLRQRKIVK